MQKHCPVWGLQRAHTTGRVGATQVWKKMREKKRFSKKRGNILTGSNTCLEALEKTERKAVLNSLILFWSWNNWNSIRQDWIYNPFLYLTWKQKSKSIYSKLNSRTNDITLSVLILPSLPWQDATRKNLITRMFKYCKRQRIDHRKKIWNIFM